MQTHFSRLPLKTGSTRRAFPPAGRSGPLLAFPVVQLERQQSPSTKPPPPRFGLAHPLLWTACFCGYLAVVRALSQQQIGWVGAVVATLQAIGGGWVGLLIFASRRLRRAGWPIEPGEWLLAVLGTRLVLEVSLAQVPKAFFTAPETVLAALTGCLLVVPALSRRLPTPWKVLFCVLALLYSGPLLAICLQFGPPEHQVTLTQIARFISWLRSGVTASLVVVVAGVVHFRGRRFGWLHWAGLGVCLWMTALPAISSALP